MEAKLKAEELLLKYLRLQEKDSYNWFNRKLAKQSALIAVDEILIVCKFYNDTQAELEYWQEVKQEIQNL